MNTTITITFPIHKRRRKGKCSPNPHITSGIIMAYGVKYPFCPNCGSFTSW